MVVPLGWMRADQLLPENPAAAKVCVRFDESPALAGAAEICIPVAVQVISPNIVPLHPNRGIVALLLRQTSSALTHGLLVIRAKAKASIHILNLVRCGPMERLYIIASPTKQVYTSPEQQERVPVAGTGPIRVPSPLLPATCSLQSAQYYETSYDTS